MLTQTIVVLPILSVLLEHPDFHKRMTDSRIEFAYEGSLTQGQMIEEVEICFSEIGKCPFLESLGYAFGTINAGLAYAHTALVEHPDFLLGVSDAEKGFYLDGYEYQPLSQDQMIALVEHDLSRSGQARYEEMFEDRGPSYFWSLGYVFGIINEGLTYA